jgi:hypothetical protein
VPPSVLKLPVDWPPTKFSAQRSRGGSTTALSRSKCRLLCAREPALARKLSYRSSPSDFVRYRSKVGPRPQSESPSELSSPSQGTSPKCFPAGGTGSTMHDIFHMFLSPYLNLDYNVVLKAVPPSGLKLLVDWLAIKGVRVKTAITSTTGDELLCFCRRCNCVRQHPTFQCRLPQPQQRQDSQGKCRELRPAKRGMPDILQFRVTCGWRCRGAGGPPTSPPTSPPASPAYDFRL